MDRLEQAGVWGAYAAQVRGRVPEWAPPGAVVEQDGPLVRTHYGTHGTVGHRPLTHIGRGELAELVRRQQEAFGARSEPVEWKAYGADPSALAEELEAAGFAHSTAARRIPSGGPKPVSRRLRPGRTRPRSRSSRPTAAASMAGPRRPYCSTAAESLPRGGHDATRAPSSWSSAG